VTLRLRRNSTGFATNAGLTPNQAAAGGSLDAAIAAGNAAVFTTYAALYDTLLIEARDGRLAGQLESLSGDALTPYPLAAQRSAQRFGEQLEQYTWSNSSNLWGLVAYADEQADGDGNGPGFKASGPVFQIGFNTSLAEGTRMGLSLGYSKIDLDSSQLTGAIDTWSTGVRLRQDFRGFYAAGQGTYSWHSDDSKRMVASGAAAASYNAQTWTLGGELGGVFSLGQFSAEPFASVRHAETRQDGFSETGPVTALAVAAEDYRTTRFGGGLRLVNRDPAASTHFEGSLRYEHENGDSAAALDNALPGLPAFRVLGTELGEDIFSAQAGIEFHVSKTATVFAGASGSWRTNESNVEANGGLRVRF
jgi:outer membrane autotransporter protein